MLYHKELELAEEQLPLTKKNLAKLSKSNRKKMDQFFHEEHAAAFQKVDCLNCANCCKTTSPIFRDIDVKRLSKHLRMSERQFIQTYLRTDEDEDYVLKVAPCPFLLDDNSCGVYDDRPLACKEFPHTNRKNMFQITDLTVSNSLVCPAVALITQKMNDLAEKNT